ncbi:subtype B tannase [Luteolibacter pohnpeiensis]
MVALANAAMADEPKDADPLKFDANAFTKKSLKLGDDEVAYRAVEGIVYVAKPVDPAYQQLNFYVPEAYFEDQAIGDFTKDTAPIFFPNQVGGYMPGKPGTPDQSGRPPGPSGDAASPNPIAVALSKGYVVAAPGARGRTLKDQNGNFTGKAPAAIVDLKAAVRYLHHNDAEMPGDATKIISNGTSAGGALSALLGATGDNSDYEPYLKEIGAAEESDIVFAASCYCPITNLDHADAAYEWLFHGINSYNQRGKSGELTAPQIEVSEKLKSQFPAYLNNLGLTKADGTALTLDENGEGNFKDVVKAYVAASAQKAASHGEDLSKYPWLTLKDGKVTDLDFNAYITFANRMKTPPAFDALDLSAPENDLFGTATVDHQHFTEFSKDTGENHAMAEPAVIKMMNPMNYIGADGTATAHFWRIRHGTMDRDTSLAIPVMLAAKLLNNGNEADFSMPWNQGHAGDYDLDELFAWMARISK